VLSRLLALITGWTLTLHWQDVLNIILGVVAVLEFLKRRETSRECRAVLHRQASQTAAHGFAEMAREAYDLETWLQKNDWERSLELAKRLVVSLAEGLGSWSIVLAPSDKDNADASRNEIMFVERSIPNQAGDPLGAELKEDMRNRCITAAMLLAEIAGKLKTPAELLESRPKEVKKK
jgi:hypothetical protein